MLIFGVCDDQPVVCRDVRDRIVRFMESSKLEYEVRLFTCGAELLKFGKKIDILFLDIEMPKIDGFLAAERMNQKNDELIIIFLTGYTERFQRAFKVNAFRYLIKPTGPQEFNEALKDALARIFTRRKVVVDDENREILLNDSKIVYIESIGDKSVLYIENERSIVSRKTLKYWENILDPIKFVKTHKSFIVSYEYIRSYGKTAITMANGAEVPVSTRNARTVKAGLNDFIKIMVKG